MATTHEPDPLVTYRRPWTQPVRKGRSTTMTVKRACNGCGRLIGDVTREEVLSAIRGERALRDVIAECPYCTPVEKAR